jgi:hypothetical protein
LHTKGIRMAKPYSCPMKSGKLSHHRDMAVAYPVSPGQQISPRTSPLALWHLLSLDAPSIASLWIWFVASANHLRLPTVSIVAMFLSVWMLYVADRLLDARFIGAISQGDFEARHYFHNRHRRAFLAGIMTASLALAILLPHLETAAIHLYLILGGLLAGYFILIHATSSAHRLPKEIAVGLFFAAATFIPTVARRPDLRISLLPIAILFAALCSLNCLFIYAWEHNAPPFSSQPAHALTRLALRKLPPLTLAVIVLSAAISLLDVHAPWPIACAIAVSAASLLLLHHRRHQIARLTLRSLADLALTTPLLLVPFLRR